MSDLFLGNKINNGSSKIDISTATITLENQSFTYDGTTKIRNVSSVVLNEQTLVEGTNYVVIGNKAINAGTHGLLVAGIGDYDGFVGAEWNINKAQGSISVNPASLLFINTGNTDTATIGTVGDGVVSVTSSNNGVATATVDGNIVTVTSVSNGNAIITVTLSAGTNYLGDSATINVSVYTINTTLSDNTPAQIQSAVQAGIASTLWSVGDRTAEISIAGFYNVSATSACAFILGFNHNSSKEGSGVHFQFGKTIDGKDICFESLKMNSSDTNSGGWEKSVMRKTYCPAFFAALPSDWQAVIADCDKYSDNTGGGSDTASYVTKTTDKIWLLSEWEVFGVKTYANSNEKNNQNRYTYYKNGNSKIKYKHTDQSSADYWWLRSACASLSQTFCTVKTNGDEGINSAGATLGFSPGFKVA